MFEYGKIDIKPYLSELRKELERGSAPRENGSRNGAGYKDETPGLKKEAMLDFGFEETGLAKKKTISIRKTNVAAKDKTLLDEDRTKVTKDVSEENENTLTNLKRTGNTASVNKDDVKTVIKSTGSKKNVVQESGSPVAKYVAILAIVVGGVIYVYSSMNKNKKVTSEVVKTAEPVGKNGNVRQPANKLPGETAEIKGEAQLMLTHYDKQKMQVFIDGNRATVDLLNSLIVPVGKPFTLRVQIDGHQSLVKEMNLANNSDLQIQIPETPPVAYGYVRTGKDCDAQGEIRFEIFGEKRTSEIPMKEEFGIAFPMGVDANSFSTPATHEIYFKRKGEELERKVEVTIKREDQSIDLCELL